jgi:hypothetical protein
MLQGKVFSPNLLWKRQNFLFDTLGIELNVDKNNKYSYSFQPDDNKENSVMDGREHV